MKTKLIISITAIMIFSTAILSAQSWNLTGNAGTDPNLNFIGTTDGKALKFKTNNQVRMYIKANGDMGIGTQSPLAKFDVNGVIKGNELRIGTTTSATGYLASIGGKLIAEEVRVDLKAVWPDYVFDKNYSLLSLDELEQFIVKHNHLPGIPDAGNIKSSGIMLGEMQTKTMEKVEEVTLYLIQLKNENNLLKAQIADLQNQVNEIKK
ncbi:MAG: hypothetical protein ACHQNT_07410 [Bacteroidia bacterium]